jgi:hypothetical protein
MSISAARAQNENPWQGKTCAVVLTYDDGLNLDLAIAESKAST